MKLFSSAQRAVAWVALLLLAAVSLPGGRARVDANAATGREAAEGDGRTRDANAPSGWEAAHTDAKRPLVVFHVGPHKTGSTATQDALCAWRERLAADGILIFAPGGHCYNKVAASTAFELQGHPKGSAQDLKALLEAVASLRAGETLIVSSEELSKVAASSLATLREAAKAAGADVSVVAVHRRFVSRVLSFYAHYASYMTEGFRGALLRDIDPEVRRWTYRLILNNWLEAFPGARMTVVSVDGCQARGRCDVVSEVMASHVPAWLINERSSGRAKRTRSNVSHVGSNATYSAFLEWAMLQSMPGNATAKIWGTRPARPCAARRAPELLHGRVPVVCRSLADETGAADADDLAALHEIHTRIGNHLRLLHFAVDARGDLSLPEPADGAKPNYCEVDREALVREPANFEALIATAAASVTGAFLTT
ncbi:hypothetical protein DFJ74DRAFT_17445 [Hyaloraphidium curvatum]|nr:hypothetical protein DFJ74DRAFT_17445 [Hyaloraphidium curvatum]